MDRRTKERKNKLKRDREGKRWIDRKSERKKERKKQIIKEIKRKKARQRTEEIRS